MSEKELAQALFQAGFLTEEQIRSAAAQRTPGFGLADIIVRNGWLSSEQIARVSAGVSAGAPTNISSAAGVAPNAPADTPWSNAQAAAASPPPIPSTFNTPISPPAPYRAPAPIPEPSGYIPPPSYTPPSGATNLAQQSGMGAASTLPAELQGFSWAAFLMSWIWGIAHNTWIALVALVIGFVPVIGPIGGLAFGIWLGAKGNELAWQNRKWDSIEQFRSVQKIWTRWGLGLILFSLLCLVLVAMLTMTGRRISNTFNPAAPPPGLSMPMPR